MISRQNHHINKSLPYELPCSKLVLSTIAPPAEPEAGSITAPPFPLPESMPMHPALAAIEAAERCIANLQRGAVISTTDLVIMTDAVGEPCEMLWRRVKVGWFPLGDVDLVIENLQDYIDDRRLELPR